MKSSWSSLHSLFFKHNSYSFKSVLFFIVNSSSNHEKNFISDTLSFKFAFLNPSISILFFTDFISSMISVFKNIDLPFFKLVIFSYIR